MSYTAYESQTDEEAVAEDDAACETTTHTPASADAQRARPLGRRPRLYQLAGEAPMIILDRAGNALRRVLRGCFLAAVVALAGCCGDGPEEPGPQPSFLAAGLDGRIVYGISEIGGRMYAATDRGLFRHLDAEQWQLVGDAAWRIVDWVQLDTGHWLLSTADGDSFELISKYELFETRDGGESWDRVVHDFGGDEPGNDEPEPLLRLLAVGDELYGTGWGALGVSTDAGRHWDLRGGMWRRLATGLSALTLSPGGRHVWYGGQGSIEAPVLERYDVIDGTHAELGNISALLPPPSTVKAVRFDPHTPGRVLVCGEGGIIQSRDDGSSWEPFVLNSNYRFYFEVIADEREPGTFYTAGWSKIVDEPQPLVLEVSRDNGASWQQYQHPDPGLFGGVYSLLAREEDDERVLYLGLFKGGVMRVSQIP